MATTTTAGIDDLQSLLAHPGHIVLEALAGSQAYGTAHAGSDVDIRGVYVLPLDAYASLAPPAPQVADARGDVVYYSLRRFLELAADANPSALELLFTPPDCVRRMSPCLEPLIERRGLFVTRRAARGLLAFAGAQIKKAKGRNKWINRPQPESPPDKEDFCWFIPRAPAPGAMPYRPVPLGESGVVLAECHAASLEHVADTFRLYHYGSGARGVFRKGTLACESIPIEDEDARCIGLLAYNRGAYGAAMRDHQNYWIWRRARNEARWRSQEQGALDYDAKNMMHTFRLLYSCEHMLAEGAPLVRIDGDRLEFLKAVRGGAFSYEELTSRADALATRLECALETCELSDAPVTAAADALLRAVTAAWEKESCMKA